MPTYCCVPMCNGKGGFRFPQTNQGLKAQWIQSVRRVNPDGTKWVPTDASVVCEVHFKRADFKPPREIGAGQRRQRLNDDVVPTKFSFKTPIVNNQARQVRVKIRSLKSELCSEPICVIDESTSQDEKHIVIAQDECIEVEEVVVQCHTTEEMSHDVGVECDFMMMAPESTMTTGYRVENFKDCDEDFDYLTGFINYDHFQMLYSALGPAVNHLSYTSRALTPKNELFLTLMKLRQAKDDHQLHIDFQISRPTVGKIFNTWMNFLYFELSEMPQWVPKTVVDEFFPLRFKTMFPTTRVVLDATENPINKPSNCNAQRITFSTYKNKNTVKTMIGVAPRGLITYLSPTYGGSVSDRQIMERSTLLVKNGHFEKGDSIMADRGIMVQDLFSSMDVRVNTPTTMKGKNQLDAQTVMKDRRIASKRIHIERVIGYAKTFKILQHPFNHEKTGMAERIVHVCFLLTNFRSSIVGKWA